MTLHNARPTTSHAYGVIQDVYATVTALDGVTAGIIVRRIGVTYAFGNFMS